MIIDQHHPDCRRSLPGWMGESTPPCTCPRAHTGIRIIGSFGSSDEIALPEGWAVFRLVSGEPTAAEIAKAPHTEKLARARAALQQAERKTNGQRR